MAQEIYLFKQTLYVACINKYMGVKIPKLEIMMVSIFLCQLFASGSKLVKVTTKFKF